MSDRENLESEEKKDGDLIEWINALEYEKEQLPFICK